MGVGSDVAGVVLVLLDVARILSLVVHGVFLQVGLIDVIRGHPEDLGDGDEKMEEVDDLDAGVLLVELLILGPPLPRYGIGQLGHLLLHGAEVVEDPFDLFFLGHAGGFDANALVERLLHQEDFFELVGHGFN